MQLTYYDYLADGYDLLYGPEQQKKMEIIVSLFPIVHGPVLDLGCGSGVSFGRSAVGVDPSFQLLQLAQKKHPHAFFVQAKGEYLPFRDNSFSLVQCITALHNFDDWHKGLIEMRRVSRKWVLLSLLKKAHCFAEVRRCLPALFSIRKECLAYQDHVFLCQV